MFEPVKDAFGRFIAGFYAGLIPTTKGMNEFCSRGLVHSVAWAPGRMVDLAEEMLELWHKNDPDPLAVASTKPVNMPVIIVAMARDYTPTSRDYTRQIASPEMFVFPDDAKERLFMLRTISGDVRAQVAIFSHDEPTARSIAAQFYLYVDLHRRFRAFYRFAGQERPWPVQLEAPDGFASNIATENKNLTILAMDLSLKVTVPLYQSPGDSAPNDGKGTPGSLDDPHGYPYIGEISIDNKELAP